MKFEETTSSNNSLIFKTKVEKDNNIFNIILNPKANN